MQNMKCGLLCNGPEDVFSREETDAMRGLWCLIVVLVHIPVAYQNSIQDMLGSFAYIGVSFFFMTSGFGLMLGVEKNGTEKLNVFWKRRLPKLLIPMAITNVLTMVMTFAETGKLDWLQLIGITGFVRQLLLFYLVFWAACQLASRFVAPSYRKRVLYGAVALLILVVYAASFVLTIPLWPVESVGFLLGMLLAQYRNEVRAFLGKKWMIKCVVACIASAILGLMYIKMKHIVFLGDYIVRILLNICIQAFVLCVNYKVSVVNVLTKFLGKISYEVYLLHSVVFSFLMILPVTFGSWTFIVVSMMMAVLLSAFVEIISGRINKHFFRKK